jgi:hypothetical protein
MLKANKIFNINDRQSSYCEDEMHRTIESRCEFLTFGEVDTFREQFKASVLIRSRWIEPEAIDEYDPEKHWNPHLYIQNLMFEKFFETIKYKCVKLDNNRTEIHEIRTCQGLTRLIFFYFDCHSLVSSTFVLVVFCRA